ncbi:MAG: FecR domain-containing protein [Candidatus Andeanibacterium colombiense]|uniref:FecR domain-containing protein n=1 Tax=Candidatus Andeanibacterium colombiense TaxID=3121345 RepID=A0AAJ5X2U7_9SPHN|nr:MAG: FecR domain-containing protein [Sphingomonadaceae bacterium]
MKDIAEPNEEVQDAARAWVARLVSGNVDQATMDGFAAWQAESSARAAAFDTARRLYAQLPASEAAEAALSAGAPARRTRRRAIAGGALAASLLAAVLLARPEMLFPPDYAAPDGPAVQVALADGSRILLDGGSAVDVHFIRKRRDIALLRGRAWFEVEPDRSRPFVVSANGGTATAVGTAYAVDTTDPGVTRVDVTHGVVKVQAAGEERLLRIGEAARWGTDGVARVAGDPDRLAWQEGRIIVRDRRLDDAAALLDHYIPGRVMVLGGLAEARVGGIFETHRAEEGLAALARSQGARVRHLPGLILVSAW